jgi:hypothetical protein
MSKRPISLLALLLFPALAAAQAPTIFFLDLTSGPNSGGENGNGTILTIYGKNFGSTQGSSTVTVGGHAVAAYLQWGASAPGEENIQKISVAIGSTAATGNVVVTTSAGSSNGIAFTVRSGNIDCVSTTGSDSNNGQFSSDPTSRSGTKGCWATIVNAKNNLAAGDIAYVENGVSQTSDDDGNTGIAVYLSNGGTSGNPKALLAYPGASVTIGLTSKQRAFYANSGSGVTYWIFEGFTVRASDEAFNLNDSTFMWIIGNDVSCPPGASDTACILGDSSGSNNLHFLGNYIHDTGTGGCSSDCHTYHALYISTNGHSWEAGWNTIVPDPSSTGTAGCRAIEIYSTGGADEYDIHIHDNIIHNVICDGIDFSQVNPDGTDTMGGQGSVEAYNNIIYHAGTAVPNSGESNYSCIQVGAQSAHTNPVQIYNNTLYDCGSRGNSDSGMLSFHDSNIKIKLTNNIIRPIVAGSFQEPWFTANSTPACTNSSGSNNLWYGDGTPPCGTTFTSNLNVDPQFVDPVTARNFHLSSSSSPAIGAGSNISTLLFDLDGISRPTNPADGVYEFFSGVLPAGAPFPAIFAKLRAQAQKGQHERSTL